MNRDRDALDPFLLVLYNFSHLVADLLSLYDLRQLFLVLSLMLSPQSTTNPPSLHVLAFTSFTTLHIIPSASLVPFTHSSPLKPNTNNASVSDMDTHAISCLDQRKIRHFRNFFCRKARASGDAHVSCVLSVLSVL